jgi:transcriptional regulator with XRE-family HTH domain
VKSIGSRLKKARESKRLSLEDAQKALRIHPNILRALEEDRAEQFLSPVYTKSFLKTYARFLGLPYEKIAEEYSTQHAGEEAEQVLFLGKEKDRLKDLKKYLPLATKVIAAALIVLIVFVFTRGLFRFTRRIIIRRPATVETREKAQSPGAKSKEPAINIPKNKPLKLVVKAREDVWIEIKSDGELLFRNVLSKRSVETWKAKEKIELWVGKAQALELILNGRKLGSPGRGVQKGVLITHQGMKLP